MAGVSGSMQTDSEKGEEEGEDRDGQGRTGNPKTHEQHKGSTTTQITHCQGVTNIENISASTVNITGQQQVQLQHGLQDGLGEMKKVQDWTEILHERTLTRLKDWARGMVKTSALDKAMEKLNKGIDWITIRGSPGEGKTTVGCMALGELHEQGRDVFLLTSPSEFTQVTTTRPSAIIMLDNVFGNLEFDRVKWHTWKDALHEVLSLKEHRSHELQRKKSVTVILIGREYVLKTAYSDMGRLADYFTQDEHVVNMSHTTERGMEEKKAIWKALSDSSRIDLDENTVDKICRINVPHGFPHVCRLFVTIRKKCPKITAEEFFETPLEFLKETVLQFMNDKLKLILFKELIKSEGKVSIRELGKLDSGSDIIQTADDLVGTYLSKEDDYFVFDHPSIYDSVAYNICKLYPQFVIGNCNLSFIHERVRIESSRDTHDTSSRESGVVIHIPRSCVRDLAKRFKLEISKRNLWQVFSHKEFRDEIFTKEVMPKLQRLAKLIKLTDCRSDEKFLSLLASNKSPQLLKYVHNHFYRQLTKDEINTVLYGVCKYAASDVLTCLTQICDTLDINVEYRDSKRTPLIMAAETRDSQFVKDILSFNPDVNARDKCKKTAFHYLCKNGLVSAVTQTIDSWTDINMEDGFGWSPLTNACWGNQIEVVKLLLDRSATRVDGEAVKEAVRHGSVEIVNLLFKRGATVYMKSDNRDTPLHSACMGGSVEIVSLLFERGATVNMTSEYGHTPLHTACMGGSVEIVGLLFENGATVDMTSDNGDTPLHSACMGGSVEIVNLLFEKGATVNMTSGNGDTPLHSACRRGNMKVIRYLTDKGASVNVKGGQLLRSPLYTACFGNQPQAVQYLLDHGADTESGDYIGETPLHRAAEGGSKECVDVLLKVGADVNVQNTNGYTPLHKAAGRGSKECVDVLLKAGSDGNVQNRHGHISLHTAVYYKPDSGLSYINLPDTSVCQTLIIHTSDVNKQDTEGNTPLHLLCRVDSDTEIRNDWTRQPAFSYKKVYRTLVTLLVDHGADVNKHNNRGEPALRGWCKRLEQDNKRE